ncbi:MAG: acyltransferase domain-containing protein [Gemmataceae bacterium]
MSNQQSQTSSVASIASDSIISNWETEVLILRGADRARLTQRLHKLTDFLRHHTDVSLTDLAYTLNTESSAGRCRLALVSRSLAETQAQLTKARERLSDPACKQIRDTQGIYYFEQPLYHQGQLAMLFPGEGAQYVNMLADLVPHFPEIREHFQECDRQSRRGGHVRPITDVVFPPANATAQQIAQMEKELWKLDNAISSVLMADWAVYLILQRLGLRADCMGGHSSGEFSALVAAGCFDYDHTLSDELFKLGIILQKLEDEGEVDEAILLAVATGRDKVKDILGDSVRDVFIAMDNCPHQTVVVGPPAVMVALEDTLKDQGIIHERLPFKRPYHTPLFQRFLDPVRDLYAALDMRTPKVPIYASATGELFPDDPSAIRELAVNHWASRVEFRRMITNMYDHGVRLFVEVGPRGNLTSFVEDILRGKPHCAVAGNVMHRSGITQLNHLVAQLAAHHVPLNFDHLYQRRQLRRIDWESASSSALTSGVNGTGSRDHPSPNGTGHGKDKLLSKQHGDTAPENNGQLPHASEPSPTSVCPVPSVSHPVPSSQVSARSVVMEQYWKVMEQFLDVQSQLMHDFMNARRHQRGTAEVKPTPPSHGPLMPQLDESTPETPLPLPMLGEIVSLEPGREIIMRRRMDLNEDLYVLDHTLGGRHASKVDPHHHGLPVMPMAFSIEMMAEVASQLIPGKLVIGMKKVRLHRWIPFDDDPITLEVQARVVPDQPGQIAVLIRDHGSSVRPGNPETPSVEGTVILGDRYPDAPEAGDFPLTNEGPCKYDPHQLYEGERRLFHGPVFQAVCSTDRQGEEGIEGHLQTLTHATLFRSHAAPRLFTDPLLIDASTHILGCWHLGQPNQYGRVVFPYELGAVEIYGPNPPVGTRMKCRVRIEKSSARQVTHRIEIIYPDGRIWCRLNPAEYWRFYWPQEYVHYFRFKENYIIGQPWTNGPAIGGDKACLLKIDPPADLCHPVKRAALAHMSMCPSEWQQFRVMKGPDQQLTEFVFSRIAAKDAVRTLWLRHVGEKLFPADMEVVQDEYGKPSVRLRGQTPVRPLPNVSIAHSGRMIAVLAAFRPWVGVDVEHITARGPSFDNLSFDEEEKALLNEWEHDHDEWVTRFWCAKEALTKALGRGLIAGPRSALVRGVDPVSGTLQLILGAALAAEFPDFAGTRLQVYTFRDEQFIVAATFCERMDHDENDSGTNPE